MRRTTSAVLGIAAVAALTSLAGAAPIFNFEVDYNGAPIYSTNTNPGTFTVTPGPSGTWNVSGSYATLVGFFNFDLVLHDDPFCTSNFNLTNTSGASARFTTQLTLQTTSPLSAPITSQGSISGSIGDNSTNFDGASLWTSPGSSFFAGLINGGVNALLYTDPAAIVAPGGLTQDIPDMSFSNNPAAQPTSIGIVNDFVITNDDSVGMISRFDVVPTPGAASLMGVAGLLVSRRRR